MTAAAGPFFVVATLLGVAGVAKLRRPVPTATAMRAAGLPGSPALARALGAVEVAVAVLALVFGGVSTALVVAAAYVGFASVSIRLMARPAAAGCGCFGDESTPVTNLHVALNLGAAALAALAALSPTEGLPDADRRPPCRVGAPRRAGRHRDRARAGGVHVAGRGERGVTRRRPTLTGLLLAVETVVLALLALLVIGLLRSHAEILRRLHDLGVDLEDPRPRTVTRDQFNVFPQVPQPGAADALPEGRDLSGVDIADDAISVRVVGVPHTTLVAFLSGTA